MSEFYLFIKELMYDSDETIKRSGLDIFELMGFIPVGIAEGGVASKSATLRALLKAQYQFAFDFLLNKLCQRYRIEFSKAIKILTADAPLLTDPIFGVFKKHHPPKGVCGWTTIRLPSHHSITIPVLDKRQLLEEIISLVCLVLDDTVTLFYFNRSDLFGIITRIAFFSERVEFAHLVDSAKSRVFS